MPKSRKKWSSFEKNKQKLGESGAVLDGIKNCTG
jgi:hypothetical protein